MRVLHQPLLFATLVAAAVAVPAFGQTTSSPLTTYAACTATPSKQDSDQAHSAFLLGKRFFDEADYSSAIHNFVDAYKLDCTKTELLTIIARAHELNGNRPEAVHALETYLQRAQTIPADDKSQIQKRIDNLKAQIAAQQPTAVLNPPPSATMAPTATAPSAPSSASQPPPPHPPAEHSAVPWVLTGVGAAAVVGGVVMLAVGVSKVSDAANGCPNNVCQNQDRVNSATSEDHQGRGLETAGGVVGGVGLVALVGGLVWHFTEGPKQEARAGVRPVVNPVVGRGLAGLSVGGRF